MSVECKIEDYLETIFLDGLTPTGLSLSTDLFTELLKSFMTNTRYSSSYKQHFPNFMSYQSALFAGSLKIVADHSLEKETIKAIWEGQVNGIERALTVLKRRQGNAEPR